MLTLREGKLSNCVVHNPPSVIIYQVTQNQALWMKHLHDACKKDLNKEKYLVLLIQLELIITGYSVLIPIYQPDSLLANNCCHMHFNLHNCNILEEFLDDVNSIILAWRIMHFI